MSSVQHETPYIVEAVLDSQPIPSVAEPCEGDLRRRMYEYDKGGFVGGQLCNIYTAALNALRAFPNAALIEKPVAPRIPVASTIGRIVVQAMNDSLHGTQANTTVSPKFLSKASPPKHFCHNAEAFFAADFLYGKGSHFTPTAILNPNDEVVVLEKGSGEQSSIVMHKDGIIINDIWYPPGTICAVSYHDIPEESDAITTVSTDNIDTIAPLRMSAFGIPAHERYETFTTPVGLENYGHTKSELKRFTTIDIARGLLHSHISRAQLEA